jgi:hypothetical protein
VIHGEPSSSAALAAAIKEKFGLDAYVPRWGEILSLEPGAALPEILPVAAPEDRVEKMLGLTAELEAAIARLRTRLAGEETKPSESDVHRLMEIRDELQAMGSQ